MSPTLEAPAAESASLPLGGHGLPSYLSDAERDCLGGQDISLGVGWLAAGAPGAAGVLPCLSDRSLNRMVYLDPQVDSSGILLGAVDCLDESPTGPALRGVLSESPGGAAPGAPPDRVLGILLSTSFTVGECLTPGEYRAMGLSAVWDHDTMLCVLEGAGGSAALVDAMSSGVPGGFGKAVLGIEECWESGGGVFGEPLHGGEAAASSPVREWLGEDPTRARRETADRLSQLWAYNPALVGRIMEMPFMASHEPAGAVAALAYLSIRDPALADSIMAHSSLAGGITDGQTHAVALAYGSVSFGGSAARTLEPGLLHVTSSKGRLPLSGPVSITVATESPAETGHLHPSIEKWLGWLEEYLETPLPTANVLVHYGRGLPSPATGGNVGVSIIHPPGYAAPANFHWTQHELVHYWFVGNEGWIDEGLAQALTSLMEANGTDGTGVTPFPRSRPCSGGGKIVDTIGATPQGSVADWCTYNLGELFMLVLYDEGGPEAFRRGAGALAAAAQARAYPPLGLEDVRAAFAHIPEALEEAERRWYHR